MILALGKWLIGSRLGIICGLLIAAAILAPIGAGVIYMKGRSDAKQDQRINQLERNEEAKKDRREVDRAVPRTDWDDRVDELR